MHASIERFTTINAGDVNFRGFDMEAIIDEDGLRNFTVGSSYEFLNFTSIEPRHAAKHVVFVDGATMDEDYARMEEAGVRFVFAPGEGRTQTRGAMLVMPQCEVVQHGLEEAIHRGQIESTTYFYGREKELWTKLAREHPLIVQQMVAYGVVGSTAYDRHRSRGFENIAGHNPLVEAVFIEALAACGYSVEERKVFGGKGFGHDVGKRGEITYTRGLPPQEAARRIIDYHSRYYQDGTGKFIHDDMERVTGVDMRGIDTKPLEWLALRFADSAVDGSRITPDWRTRIDNLRVREEERFASKGVQSPLAIVTQELYGANGLLGKPVENYYEDVLKRTTAFCEERLFEAATPDVQREVKEPQLLLPYLLHRMSTRPAVLQG